MINTLIMSFFPIATLSAAKLVDPLFIAGFSVTLGGLLALIFSMLVHGTDEIKKILSE